MQKLFYLPEPHTDFIFANICEELGLIGALLIVGLVCACWGIAGCGRRFFRPIRLRGSWRLGLTTAILIQAFFNMSVVLALLPTKGIPLPFISFGRDFDLYYAGEHGRAAEYYARDRLSAGCRE